MKAAPKATGVDIGSHTPNTLYLNALFQTNTTPNPDATTN